MDVTVHDKWLLVRFAVGEVAAWQRDEAPSSWFCDLPSASVREFTGSKPLSLVVAPVSLSGLAEACGGRHMSTSAGATI
jgi:hypothetical protein